MLWSIAGRWLLSFLIKWEGCKSGIRPQTSTQRKVQRNYPILPQEVHDHAGNWGTLHTQQLMESSLHLPIHPGGGTSDLATRNHAGLSVEEPAFFLLQGRQLCIRKELEQGCSMRKLSQDLRTTPLSWHSPTVSKWGQSADSNMPRGGKEAIQGSAESSRKR